MPSGLGDQLDLGAERAHACGSSRPRTRRRTRSAMGSPSPRRRTPASEPVLPPVYSTPAGPAAAGRRPRRPDHRQRDPVLVRAGRVGRFHLHPDLGATLSQIAPAGPRRTHDSRNPPRTVHRRPPPSARSLQQRTASAIGTRRPSDRDGRRHDLNRVNIRAERRVGEAVITKLGTSSAACGPSRSPADSRPGRILYIAAYIELNPSGRWSRRSGGELSLRRKAPEMDAGDVAAPAADTAAAVWCRRRS